MFRNIIFQQKNLHQKNTKNLFFSSWTKDPTHGKHLYYPKYGNSFYEYDKILKQNVSRHKNYNIENELWCIEKETTQRGSEIHKDNPRIRPVENPSTNLNIYDERED